MLSIGSGGASCGCGQCITLLFIPLEKLCRITPAIFRREIRDPDMSYEEAPNA